MLEMIEKVTLTEANRRYEELIDKASNGDTFVITKYGRETAVLLSYEEFEKLAAKPDDPVQPQAGV
jgi:prevent-host-death family protein